MSTQSLINHRNLNFSQIKFMPLISTGSRFLIKSCFCILFLFIFHFLFFRLMQVKELPLTWRNLSFTSTTNKDKVKIPAEDLIHQINKSSNPLGIFLKYFLNGFHNFFSYNCYVLKGANVNRTCHIFFKLRTAWNYVYMFL